MLTMFINFANLLISSLVTGAMFGAWLLLNPASLSGPDYVVMQQQGIRTMNIVMPALGAGTIALTLVAAAMSQTNNLTLGLRIAAAIAFLAVGVITRFANQPINAVVMTWSAAPPDDWTHLRDIWWRWHLIRLAFGLCGLIGLVLATLLSKSSR